MFEPGAYVEVILDLYYEKYPDLAEHDGGTWVGRKAIVIRYLSADKTRQLDQDIWSGGQLDVVFENDGQHPVGSMNPYEVHLAEKGNSSVGAT